MRRRLKEPRQARCRRPAERSPSRTRMLSELSGRAEVALARPADLVPMTSSTLLRTMRRGTALAARPCVEIVIPVYNEQAQLERSVRRLHRFLREGFPFTWSIVIADNASTDDTPRIAARLASELSSVRVLRLERKGRGHALRVAWSRSEAEVVSYMDVDLSTDLRALLPLVAPLVS